MNKNRLLVISIIALLLISAAGATIHASSRTVALGILVDAYVLPDGGSLVLSVVHNTNTLDYKLTHIDAVGNSIESNIQAIPTDSIEPVEYVYLSVCGNYVQMFMNWHNVANDEVYLMRTIWDLEIDTGVCEQHPRKVFLPILLK